MAVGTTAAIVGGAMIAGGALTATTQIAAGRAQAKSYQRQGEFNAQVYEQQAGMIQEQKKLEEYQYNRRAAKLRGSIISRTAGAGVLLSGSPLALLIDSETQLQYDKAIGQYNLDVQSRFAQSAAANARYAGQEQARLAKFTGYSKALSTILNTGTNIGMMNLGGRGRKP